MTKANRKNTSSDDPKSTHSSHLNFLSICFIPILIEDKKIIPKSSVTNLKKECRSNKRENFTM
jgi:hypothetical protein